MTSSMKSIDAITSAGYKYNNTILLPSLEERLHAGEETAAGTATFHQYSTSGSSLTILTKDSLSLESAKGLSLPSIKEDGGGVGTRQRDGIGNGSSILNSLSHIATVMVSNFLPLTTSTSTVSALSSSAPSIFLSNDITGTNSINASATDDISQRTSDDATLSNNSRSNESNSSRYQSTSTISYTPSAAPSSYYPSFSPPVVESLVANSAEEFSNNFPDLSFDIFDDNDNDLFGSPLAFDASENGLWNGRFVPPPPRPPFFVDEPVLSDGLTTCDLCSWAMPTKSTFIFEGTMEKASELGWPLTLTIVSILSAILGAFIMIAVVKCRRKKSSHQRSDTHVQWWSRNKRPSANANNNHLRRSNIYTAHPADNIRGLQPPQPNSLSASSSMTAITTAAGVGALTPTALAGQMQSHFQSHCPYFHGNDDASMQSMDNYHHQQQQQQHLQQNHQQLYADGEHEYHQPQELQRLPMQSQEHLQQHSNCPHSPQLSAQSLNQQQQHLQQQHHFHSHFHPQQQYMQHHHYHPHHQQQQQQSQYGPEIGMQLQHSHSFQPQHQHTASTMSSSSSATTTSMPSLSTMPLHRQMPEQKQHAAMKNVKLTTANAANAPASSNINAKMMMLNTAAIEDQQSQHQEQLVQQQHEQEQHQQEPKQQQQPQERQSLSLQQQSEDLHDNMFHWPTATSLVTR